MLCKMFAAQVSRFPQLCLPHCRPLAPNSEIYACYCFYPSISPTSNIFPDFPLFSGIYTQKEMDLEFASLKFSVSNVSNSGLYLEIFLKKSFIAILKSSLVR